MSTSDLAKMPQAGVTVTETLGTTEIQRAAETSAIALAEREKATIQAMFVVADSRRRSISQFEQGLLKDCERPGFAEVARYKKPQRHRDPETKEWVDGFIEGWSIRFAEAALRHWKNVFNDAKIVYEDQEKRIIRFMLIDLESNLPFSTELQLSKTVERGAVKGRDGKWGPPYGREVIAERQNTKGHTVYVVAATDDELYMKQAAHWSKFIRNALRFMPGDILDSALEQIQKTLKGLSPEAARDRMILGFDAIGVSLADLQAYLRKSLSKIEPKEVDELRQIYTAIKTEETTWARVMEGRMPPDATTDPAVLKETKLKKIQEIWDSGNHEAARKMAEDWNLEFKPPTEQKTEAQAPEVKLDEPVKDAEPEPEKQPESTFANPFKKGKK